MSILNDRLQKALAADPTIVIAKDKIHEHKGHTEAHLISLGLTKGDLIRLERGGLAVRAYSQNVYLPGDTLPNGTAAKGEYTTIPKKTKVPIKDSRGFDRKLESLEDIQVPSVVYRGQGRRKYWIIVC